MVAGIEKFREHFAGHEDHYAIIGGAACDLLFDAAGLAFRATKDIDMVLCVEVVDPAGAVAGVVGIGVGVVSGVFNLESSDVGASDRRPRHDNDYHECRCRSSWG